RGPSRSTSMISSGFPAATATAARVFIWQFLQRDFALRLSGFGLLINRQMRRNIGFLDAGSTPLTAGVRHAHGT
ncbi:hypothetical protein LB561_20095, partial [Mesorhizobium sp. B292B1B]|uniref:hypothetical protein n=1 Tax=unclassified Mesorhizobium TaxID=325217 RepID=UPI001AEEB7AE